MFCRKKGGGCEGRGGGGGGCGGGWIEEFGCVLEIIFTARLARSSSIVLWKGIMVPRTCRDRHSGYLSVPLPLSVTDWWREGFVLKWQGGNSHDSCWGDGRGGGGELSAFEERVRSVLALMVGFNVGLCLTWAYAHCGSRVRSTRATLC